MRQRLQDVFAYLHNPTFDEYYRLKTDEIRYEFALSKSARVFLQKRGLMNAALEQGEPRDVARTLWDAVITWHNEGAPSRLMAVCIDDVGIAVNRSNSPDDILGGKASKGHTAAHSAFDPGFKYGASVGPSGAGATEDLFLHLSFIARSNASEHAAPMHVSLYWSEQDQNWALSRMFTDVLLKMNNLF